MEPEHGPVQVAVPQEAQVEAEEEVEDAPVVLNKRCVSTGRLGGEGEGLSVCSMHACMAGGCRCVVCMHACMHFDV